MCACACICLCVCISWEHQQLPTELRQEVELNLAGCNFMSLCLLRMEISGSVFSCAHSSLTVVFWEPQYHCSTVFYFGETNNRLRFSSKRTFFNALFLISIFLCSPLYSSRLSSNNFSRAFWHSLTCRSTSSGVLCNRHTGHRRTKLTCYSQPIRCFWVPLSDQMKDFPTFLTIIFPSTHYHCLRSWILFFKTMFLNF